MGTKTLDISSGGPAQNQPKGTERLVDRRWPWLLFVTGAVLAFVPYFVPERLTRSVPRFGVVVYYAVLSLVIGCFGIAWIFRTARRVFSADHEERNVRS